MLRPMTDQELAPFEKGAPLMVERYRELRQAAEQLAAAGIAAQRSLKLAREALEKEQTRVRELTIDMEEKTLALNHKEGLTESWREKCLEAREEVEQLKHEITELNSRTATE